MLLAGDIGGTKTRLAIFSLEHGPRAVEVEATFPSAAYAGLAEIIAIFLRQNPLPIERATLGVAGPVVAGRVRTTNLPWVVDAGQLAERFGFEDVELLNDLQATAYAIPLLEPAELHTLHAGSPEPAGTIAVVAPGTGLGEAFLTWDGRRYRAHASEGSHASFGPIDGRQIELLQYLLPRFGHVSYERVCSGIGMPNIYAFLRDAGYAEEPEWLAEQLAGVEDPTPIISAIARDPTIDVPLCSETLVMFIAILAAEAGNLALKVLATGGVYLGGGIPPRILPMLDPDAFIRAFRHKGRMSGLLAGIPVHIILYREAPLLGAAARGLGL